VKQKAVGSTVPGAVHWKSNQTILIRCNLLFSPQGYSSLLIFAISKTIGLLWEASLSAPLALGLHCNTLCYGSPNSSLITVVSGLVMHYMP
jgi:hypothetical protein